MFINIINRLKIEKIIFLRLINLEKNIKNKKK